MGYKNVCLACKRVESLGTDRSTFRTGACPVCSAQMYFVCEKFRPPRIIDEMAWAVAAYLISNGYTYFTIRDERGMPITYPETMESAKQFVAMHRAEASKWNARRKHELEQRLIELSKRPQNPSRDELMDAIATEIKGFR